MRLTGSAISLFFTATAAAAQDASIQLHELYEPDPVTFRFETPGWYILAGIILMFGLVVVFWQIRKYLKNRYRREALQELKYLENATGVFPQLFVVLKRTAIHAFGREQVAYLYGKEWLSFLEKTGKDVRMTDYHPLISRAIYAGIELEQETQRAILLSAKKWIRTHAG